MLTELDPDCRVIIVSSKPQYEGLRGLDKFFRRGLEGRKRPTVKLDELKPKPAAWVHTATVSWLNQNDTADIPNNHLADTNTYIDSNVPDSHRREGELVDALRESHVSWTPSSGIGTYLMGGEGQWDSGDSRRTTTLVTPDGTQEPGPGFTLKYDAM